MKIFGIILTILLGFSLLSYGQEPIKLQKTEAPIILDGVIDEPAWEIIDHFTPVQYEPVFMGEMFEVTKFRVTYDENFLYAAAEMYTQDSGSITRNSLSRDQYSGDDVFALILDPFNDNENGLWFFTTPAGVRIDMAIANDANGGGGASAINPSWNTFWEVATTQTEEGWFAEMKIPFSSIGFQDKNGVAEMGMIAYRWIASSNERHIYPAIPPNWNMGNAKPSQAQDVVLDGVESRKPVYVVPYALAGQNVLYDLNDEETLYLKSSEFAREIGLDVKYNLTGNLTLDVTLNTDFAQVEADDQQLNLSRFSLFFPEKRQFFQERAGLYDVAYGRNRLFYSRKIGLDDDGNPVRILGGARMTGRVGNWDVGMLNMQTGDSEILPSENFGVLRLRRRTFNDLSDVGSIFTSRLGADGSSNYVYGLDSRTNLRGDLFLELLGSQTIDSELPSSERTDFLNTSSLRAALTLQKSIGFNYRFVINRAGEDFDPGIGFVRRTGNTDTFARLAYGWFAPASSIVNQYNIDGALYTESSNENLTLLGRSIWSGFDVRFKQIGRLSLDVRYQKEILLTGDDFNLLSRIYIPSGRYNTSRVEFGYRTNEGKRLQGGIEVEYGGLYDGSSFGVSLQPRLIVNTHLEIGGSYGFTHLSFDEFSSRNVQIWSEFDDEVGMASTFTAHLAQFKMNYAFDKKMSLNSFVQYSNDAELVGANVRFRYNFSEGRDFWLVFNEQIHTMRDQLDAPRKPFYQGRTILMKYTHTFIF